MSTTTPRRSQRTPHTYTPKMSERKKGLFLPGKEVEQESLTRHRRLSVVNSESDNDDCDLGIISTLDSSSCDENDYSQAQTPERPWRETRSHMRKFKENQDLKNFIKSPFTLTKYQTRYSCADTKCSGSLSTPVTPHFQNNPGTPSSSHSCASVHTTSSTSSKARKNLASLIADTESCSSSLKDLNFDSDSGADSKENTPTKSLRRSKRMGMTPKLSFKGILVEQKMNKLALPSNMDTQILASPLMDPIVSLTRINIDDIISPTQMMKTPHNTNDTKASPPKISHRRSVMEVQESPESCEKDKSHKRGHYDGMVDSGLVAKYPRLDPTMAPKARQSLFNTDRLKEILSAKSFYGKSNPELNTNISTKLSKAIEATNVQRRRAFATHSQRRKRKPGQINMGVRHRIRKPKIIKNKMSYAKTERTTSQTDLNKSTTSNTSTNKDSSMLSQYSILSQDEKADPFDKEKQTIDALLSQWTEEEVPEAELVFNKPQTELACFNSNVIEETHQLFQPVTAVPVALDSYHPNAGSVIVELGTPNGVPPARAGEDLVMDSHVDCHGGLPQNGEFIPVEGGYLIVEGDIARGQKVIPDLDAIEREIMMLDEQILQTAQAHNINGEAVLSSAGTASPRGTPTTGDLPRTPAEPSTSTGQDERSCKLFSIFSKPNPGISSPTSKQVVEKQKKMLLKSSSNQYVIDAGQKKFGATQCTECGVIYEIGDPQDEHDHLIHHNAVDVLRFNGLKEECVVDRRGEGRCLKVRGGEAGWKKVVTLIERLIHPQLGYATELPKEAHVYTAYLYVEKKQIVGCAIMEPKTRAYKMLPGEPNCCSVEEYPVKCGVSRIWTHPHVRRRGVARALLDCARVSLLYGTAVGRSDIAFSSPTPAGAALATAYCATPNFFVYLD